MERKASLADKDTIRQAICAFANDLPNHRQAGVVVIGQHDDGSYANLHVDDVLLRTLADLRSDGGITPFPSIMVDKRSVDRHEIAIAVAEPSCHNLPQYTITYHNPARVPTP